MSKLKVIAGFIVGILVVSSLFALFDTDTEQGYKQQDIAACVMSQILIEQNSQYKVSWDSNQCDKVIYNDNQTYLIHNHYYIGSVKMDYFMELYDNGGDVNSLSNWAVIVFDVY